MTATPRTIRAVAVPSAPRLRRVAGVKPRSFGRISLFLAATGVLGLTSLCYLWQTSQATRAALQIPTLQAQLQDVNNQTAVLQTQIDHLKSPGVVMQVANARYGMIWPDPGTGQTVSVAPRVVTRVVVVQTAPRRASTRVHLSATNVSTSSWWQDIWVALYHVMH